MNQPAPAEMPPVPVSPLMLSDRMLHLAQDADRAGLPGTAQALLSLVWAVLDEPPGPAAVMFN